MKGAAPSSLRALALLAVPAMVVVALPASERAIAQPAVSRSATAAAAQRPLGPESGRPLIQLFAPRDYGAHAQNWGITQDARGLMYFGNNEGVLEFDGVQWRVHHTPERTGVRSVAASQDGRVYVGAQGELGYLAPDGDGATAYVSLLDHIPAEHRDFTDVWLTHAMPDGAVYFSTLTSLFRWDGRAMRVWRPATGYHKSFSIHGRLYIREVDRGLLVVDGDSLHPVPGGEVFGPERLETMVPLPGGDALLCTRDAGCFHLVSGGAPAEALVPWPTEADDLLPDQLPYAGLRTAGGTLVIGTLLGGAYLLDDDGRLSGRLDTETGLPVNTIYAAYQDAQGGVWLATENGLARVEVDGPLSRFDDADELAGPVLSLHRHLGTLYAGTSTGLFRLEGGGSGRSRFVAVPGIGGQTWAFLDDGESLLVANFAGVYEVVDGRAALVRPSGPANALLRSAADPARVFVGLVEGVGVMRREGDRWVDEGLVPGIAEHARFLVPAGAGPEPGEGIWIGTQTQGVLRVRFPPGWRPGTGEAAEPSTERFGMEHGLPAVANNNVHTVAGDVVFATFDGIYRFLEAEVRFGPDPRFAGLFPDGPRLVNPVLDAGGGVVWMDSGEGVGAARLDEGGAYRWDGAPLSPLADFNAFTMYAEDDGVLWIGGPEGIVRYDARVPVDYGRPFTSLVRRVAVGEEHTVLFGGTGEPVAVRLPYERNAVRFEFAAASLDGVQANRFQTRLDGLDRDWSAWSTEVHRDYTNLREGRYTFRVRAANVYGTVSNEGIYAFVVMPPWYRTVWAYIAYLLVALGAARGLIGWRTRQMVQEKAALETLVQDRTRNLEASLAETRAANEAALRAREAAEAATRAKSEFLANMTHEIRTPLNAILGLTWLALRDDPSTGMRSYLERVAGAGEHLLGIINDVLDFSKIEAGKLVLEEAPFALADVLRPIEDLFAADAAAKGLTLVVERSTDAPEHLLGDPLRIRQVLFNLVGNALKFTDRGHVRVDVDRAPGPGAATSAGDDAIHLRFTVEDTGTGIDPAKQAELFDAFAQADAGTTRRHGGTGLGLTIADRLVRRMGGTIELESEPGSGSRFRFTIPLRESPAPAVAESAPAAAVPGARVLIVEDNPINVEIGREALERSGATVDVVSTGQDAVRIVDRVRFDVVLMDIQMPGMDGYRAAARIREQHRHRDLPIIAVTAHAGADFRDRCLAAGMNDYLTKPVDPDALLAAVAAWVRTTGAGPVADVAASITDGEGDGATTVRDGGSATVTAGARTFEELSPLLAHLDAQLRMHSPDADSVVARIHARLAESGAAADPALADALARIEDALEAYDFAAARAALAAWADARADREV